MAASQVYVFGPFHYDPEQRLLFRQGEVVPLVPKAIDTLHVLLERRGPVGAGCHGNRGWRWSRLSR